MLKIIVAMDQNRGIGIHNQLPWSIKEDLREFKRLTLGHSVIMGRKTLESIGKALPGRENFVVTHQETLPFENVALVDDVLNFFESKKNSDDIVFVIGGASLYKIAIKYCEELIISEVKGEYSCDTFFPEFNEKEFVLSSQQDFLEFSQKTYKRIKR
jgi:dihydrofolate reductase